MALEAQRRDRGARSRFSADEREPRLHAAPAADYAVDDDLYDDFEEVEAWDDEGPRDGLSSMADELIDDLVPPQVDWRRVVVRHPWPALLLAGLGGYLLGRSQGRTLVRAISALAVARVEAEVLDRFADDLD